jgi:hypothetical protein
VPRDLQYTKTVDRYFCKYGPDCVPTPVIVRVPAWRPLDCYIYDLDSEKLQKTKHKIPADFQASELCRELLSANSYQFFGDLLKGLQQQIDNTSKPHDFGSCQPKYRFCTVSDVFWSVSGFPRSTQELVPVVVRLFQHLEPETEMESVFDDFQFSANDKFAKIHETIMEALKDDEEPMALLTRHHARGESCNVELWILPQGQNYQYKFKPGEDICEFLAQEYVEKGDLRLYMEVYVVPTESVPSDRSSDEVMEDMRNYQLDKMSEQGGVSEQHELPAQDDEDYSAEEDGSQDEGELNADVNEKNAQEMPDDGHDDEIEKEDDDDEDDDESDDEDDGDADNDGKMRIKLIYDFEGLDELKTLHGRPCRSYISKRR